MPPDALVAPAGLTLVSPTWRRGLAMLGIAWLGLVIAFAADWQAMLGQWWNSSTYNHVLLIPAILGWLAWQRREIVEQLEPRPSSFGLLALGAAVLLWVLGAFAGLDLLRQAGAVAMLPASALLLLGPRVFAGLLFPFAYMAFLVPFGDELVPPLQIVTAKMTVALVHLSQIPATIDGVFIDTPAGLFEVAEACSGVKFLIAMIALGVLVGNVCFRSWPRRIAFFGLCVVVPILANGVRAWGTIFAAQYVGVEKAGGIDHLIYGWVFFAVVIAAVLGLAWRHFDRGNDDAYVDWARLKESSWLAKCERFSLIAPVALIGAAALVLGGAAWAGAAEGLSAAMPRQVFLPDVPSWTKVPFKPLASWQPRALGADHRLLGRYRNVAGDEVDVFYALYAGQGDGYEAGGFGQGALVPDSGWAWTSNGPQLAGARSDRLTHPGKIERMAFTWYRSGDLLTGSNARLKLANIGDRLLLRASPTAILILSAEQRPGHEATAEVNAFQTAIGDPGSWMDRIGQAR
jgi:exosortase A